MAFSVLCERFQPSPLDGVRGTPEFVYGRNLNGLATNMGVYQPSLLFRTAIHSLTGCEALRGNMATVMSNGYPEGYKVPEASEASSAEAFRYQVRNNNFHGTSTSGFCPGFAQANLLILPAELAGDFRLLCSRNPVP